MCFIFYLERNKLYSLCTKHDNNVCAGLRLFPWIETLVWGGGCGCTGANACPFQSHAVARLSHAVARLSHAVARLPHLRDVDSHPSCLAILEPTLVNPHTYALQEKAKDYIDTLRSSWPDRHSVLFALSFLNRVSPCTTCCATRLYSPPARLIHILSVA